MRIYITEGPQSVDTSKYADINFKDRVVGNSTPSKDKINPSLLADVDKAAKIAGTKASVTTAVTGHKSGSRHESGLAVDLAMFDGQGYHSKEDAKKKGIYDKIEKFVKALEGMGYKVNSESGNDKAVLWFGFPNHHHHVHVSRKSDNGESNTPSLSNNASTESTTTTTTISGSTETKKGKNIFQMLGIIQENSHSNKKLLMEIEKINNIILTEGSLQLTYGKITFSPSESYFQNTNKNLLNDLNSIGNEKNLSIPISAVTGVDTAVYTPLNDIVKTKLTEKGYGGGQTQNPNKYFMDWEGKLYVVNKTTQIQTTDSTTTKTTTNVTTQTTTVTGKTSVLDKADVSSGENLVNSALKGFLGGMGLSEDINSKKSKLLKDINRIKKSL